MKTCIFWRRGRPQVSRRTPQGSPASFPNPPRSPWGPPEVPRAPEMRFPSTPRIPKPRFCVEGMSKSSVSLLRDANPKRSRHAILTNSPRKIDVSEALGQIGQARGPPLWEHFGVKFLGFFAEFLIRKTARIFITFFMHFGSQNGALWGPFGEQF